MTDSPYRDWKSYDIKRGSRVSYAVGDRIITGTVESVDEDELLGTVTITFEQFDEGPPWNRSTPEQKGHMTVTDFLTGGAELPDPLLVDLKDMVHRHASSHPRHLQARLGPSEVGHPCLRKLAQGLLFAGHGSSAAPSPINPPGDPLPSYIGVAAHSKMEDAAALDNARLESKGQPPRWLTERKVTVREDLSGTCDLYDTWTATVIDHKLPGTTAMTKYRKEGPSPEYRTQAHLYGAGFINEGYPVERVAIFFLPRAGQLATSMLWSEPYNQEIVDTALARIDLAISMIGDLDVDRHPDRLALIPRTAHNCTWCPYWSPLVEHPDPAACPGGM